MVKSSARGATHDRQPIWLLCWCINAKGRLLVVYIYIFHPSDFDEQMLIRPFAVSARSVPVFRRFLSNLTCVFVLYEKMYIDDQGRRFLFDCVDDDDESIFLFPGDVAQLSL